MDTELRDKRVLVTGSTRGIGRATARAFLREGAEVILHGRGESDVAARLTDEMGLRSGQVAYVAGDLATPEGSAAAIDQIRAIGSVDVLVNNVGIFEDKPFGELSDADWQRMFDVNVMSSVRMTRALLPDMTRRGWGRIVFVASEQSAKPNPTMMHYAMSKAAQVSIARAHAELARGTGVTVNSVLVAPTWTEGVETFLGARAEEAGTTTEAMRTAYFEEGDGISSLIGRFAEPDEVAAQIVFLCSGAASAITGAAQRVDGGIVRSLY